MLLNSNPGPPGLAAGSGPTSPNSRPYLESEFAVRVRKAPSLGIKHGLLAIGARKRRRYFFSIWKRGSEKRHTVKNNLEPLPLSKDHQVTKTISLNPA